MQARISGSLIRSHPAASCWSIRSSDADSFLRIAFPWTTGLGDLGDLPFGTLDLGVGAGVGGYVTRRDATETVARHLACDAALGENR